MSTANPYEPPRANVEDVRSRAESYQPVKLWSTQGRIGRLRYLAYAVGGYFLMGFTILLLNKLTQPSGHTGPASPLLGLVMLPYGAFLIISLIKRSHDMNWSGWVSLLAFVPLVGLIWTFKAGSPGENRFGAPPPPNTTGVKVLGLLLPVIAVIGILAAIALPAYQQYTVKARAAQLQQQQQQAQPTSP